MKNSVNVRKETGPPTNRIASPITTGFSPAQGGTLDDFRIMVEDSRPEDTLGYFSQQEGKRNGNRRS